VSVEFCLPPAPEPVYSFCLEDIRAMGHQVHSTLELMSPEEIAASIPPSHVECPAELLEVTLHFGFSPEVAALVFSFEAETFETVAESVEDDAAEDGDEFVQSVEFDPPDLCVMEVSDCSCLTVRDHSAPPQALSHTVFPGFQPRQTTVGDWIASFVHGRAARVSEDLVSSDILVAFRLRWFLRFAVFSRVVSSKGGGKKEEKVPVLPFFLSPPCLLATSVLALHDRPAPRMSDPGEVPSGEQGTVVHCTLFTEKSGHPHLIHFSFSIDSLTDLTDLAHLTHLTHLTPFDSFTLTRLHS